MTPTIRVLIADDHAVVREGLRTMLEEEPGLDVLAEASTGHEAVHAAIAHAPDVVLMDVVMPGLDGIAATQQILAALPASRIVILSSYADAQQVHAAIGAGAIGYQLKDVDRPTLVRAIRSAAQGIPTLHPEAQRMLLRQIAAPPAHTLLDTLTEREQEVLKLIAVGCNNRTIATRLQLSEGTVKGYVSAILTKLGVQDRTQAALYAVRHGYDSEER